MKFIADLHIHSHYSIATSRFLTPEHLHYWAGIKGLTVIGTGDFTHPGWLEELEEKLDPAEDGLYQLKKSYRLPGATIRPVRFLLSAEISNIYKKHGRVRKIHNIILAPSFDAARQLQSHLGRLGNITSDGRPILGMDSKTLLDITLNVSPEMFFIPAHIWTPWFSALGGKSGFDSIEECFEDLSEYIYAVETGLSSDPPLNWMCSILDKYTLISNSDAHSPEKLGRNANIFDTSLSYGSLIQALKKPSPESFLGTIDLFPQEGKYHYDGHRKCNICWNPVETKKNRGICPVCGKQVTIGVMNRILQLADRNPQTTSRPKFPYKSIIPLKEIIAEVEGLGEQSKRVDAVYRNIVSQAGSELQFLLEDPIDEIQSISGPIYAESIRRLRARQVTIQEGYDGEFGKIKLFQTDTGAAELHQRSFFQTQPDSAQVHPPAKPPLLDLQLVSENPTELNHEIRLPAAAQLQQGFLFPEFVSKNSGSPLLRELNELQLAAANHPNGPALIIAGPGTGKTKTLTAIIARLISSGTAGPDRILAVTFTNKASLEMKKRLRNLKTQHLDYERVNVNTFHSFGYKFIRDNIESTNRSNDFIILTEEDQKMILENFCGCRPRQVKTILKLISNGKNLLNDSLTIELEYEKTINKYEECLIEFNALDFDDLVYIPWRVLQTNHTLRKKYQEQLDWILIDEYQDLNAPQYALIKLLAKELNPNLIAIGDPAQAIYGFRGANVQYINRFKLDFPNAKIYHLQQSYRCSQTILNASRNILTAESQLLEGVHGGVKLQLSAHPSPASEAEFVAQTIEKMMGGLRFFSMDSGISEGEEESGITSLSDFAVLCRTKHQLDAFEIAFRNHSIPYRRATQDAILKQKSAHDIAMILNRIAFPDNIFYSAWIKKHEIVSSASLEKLQILSRETSAAELVVTIFSLPELNSQQAVKDLFLESAKGHSGNLPEYCQQLALSFEFDHLNQEMEAVQLMTMHASKGLEFKAVFTAGCEENLLPLVPYPGASVDTAEERRLLYVAMTRAKQYLFLSRSQKRKIGKKIQPVNPSPFLSQIEEELIEIKKSSYQVAKKGHQQLSLFSLL